VLISFWLQHQKPVGRSKAPIEDVHQFFLWT
jgi:hypothetical protein